MKKTRLLSAILAALMLAGTATSCATANDPVDTQTPSKATAPVGDEAETQLKDNLPDDLDFGKVEMVIVNDDSGSNVVDEIFVENLNGDPINDAIFERNKTVESRLNVKIVNVRTDGGTIVDEVITSVQGGSADYDVMVARCWRAAPRTVEGYFSNLRDTEYIDFDQPWWTQSFNDVMLYKDHQYAVTGSMVLSTYRRTHTTVFNKKLFTDANQPFLYEYVDNGTWTLDKQSSLVSLLARDNGNGTQDETLDTFGFVTNNFTSADPYWAACKVDIIHPDSGDGYEWVFDSGKMFDAMEKVLKLYYSTDNGTLCLTDDDALQGKTQQIFSEGRAAMATLCIIALETSLIRNMKDEYGVVPMPKFDEAQSEYQSQMHDAFTIACVPTTVQGERLTQTSALLEAMSSTSYKQVRPVYYETTLRTKIAQDPQSSRMMEIIFNGIYIDAGIVFSHSLGTFHDAIEEIVTSKINNTVSLFKSRETIAQKQLKNLIKQLDKLVDQSY